MDIFEKVDLMIERGDLIGALASLDRRVQDCPDDARALFMRGKVYWRLGNRARATANYASAAAIDPDGPAALALEHARDIDRFYNPDIFNP